MFDFIFSSLTQAAETDVHTEQLSPSEPDSDRSANPFAQTCPGLGPHQPDYSAAD